MSPMSPGNTAQLGYGEFGADQDVAHRMEEESNVPVLAEFVEPVAAGNVCRLLRGALPEPDVESAAARGHQELRRAGGGTRWKIRKTDQDNNVLRQGEGTGPASPGGARNPLAHGDRIRGPVGDRIDADGGPKT